jgi:tetratricopeptide (TPR) repeat protein
LVDTADVFGHAFGLKAIPESFLVDEVGIIRLHGNGPSPELLRQIEVVLNEPASAVRASLPVLPAARSRAELEQAVSTTPADWQARLALAQLLADEGRFAESVQHLESAARLQPAEASVAFAWGQILLRAGRKEAALAKLKQARDLAPDNWRIRKQIRAIEHPDKFYAAESPDYGWQKEELAREKRAAGK